MCAHGFSLFVLLDHSTNVLQQDMQNFGRNVTSTPFLRFGDDLGFKGNSQIVVPQTRVQVLSEGGGWGRE